MNLIGKIFVGLIAVMSIVFFSLTLVLYASHKNWKEDSQKKQDQIAQVNQEKDKLTQAKADLEKEIEAQKTAYMKEIGALKSKSDALEAENQTLTVQNDQLEKDLQARVEVITANNSTINEYRTSIETLTNDLASAQQLRAVYLKNLADTVANLYQSYSRLGEALTVLNMKGLEPTPELYHETPPYAVTGTIEAIQDGGQGLLMISLGEDDGLKPSHTLEVSRGDTYLGRIEVVTVEPNRAVCKVLPQYRQGTMKEGDHVASQL